MIDLIASSLFLTAAQPKQSVLDRCDVPQMTRILRRENEVRGHDFLKIERCEARSLVAIAKFRMINREGSTETWWATFYGRLEQGRSVWRFDSASTSLGSQIINTPTYAGIYFNSVRGRLE